MSIWDAHTPLRVSMDAPSPTPTFTPHRLFPPRFYRQAAPPPSESRHAAFRSDPSLPVQSSRSADATASHQAPNTPLPPPPARSPRSTTPPQSRTSLHAASIATTTSSWCTPFRVRVSPPNHTPTTRTQAPPPCGVPQKFHEKPLRPPGQRAAPPDAQLIEANRDRTPTQRPLPPRARQVRHDPGLFE